jgi:hypothetical protein
MANSTSPPPSPQVKRHKSSTSHSNNKASSTYAHNGSSKDNDQPRSPPKDTTQKEGKEVVNRYIGSERDHRSFAVEEFDPHQEESRRRKEEVLRGVVGGIY